MPHAIATDRPLLWAAVSGNETIHAGQIDTTGAVATPLTLISDNDENAFLGKVTGKGGAYKPLPTSGELIAGELYSYAGGLVLVRQTHNRTGHAPADVPALFSVYRANATGALDWVANEPVLLGTQRVYGGKTYKALQKHVTQSDWTPDKTPALWAEVVESGTAWAAGQVVKVGDLRTYTDGKTYRCLQAHTTQSGWTPPAVPALWAVVNA